MPERLMRSIWATRANPPDPTPIHSALSSSADECRGMLVQLAVYLGTLALLAIIDAHLWAELPDSADIEPPAKAGWSLATRQFDLNGKTEAYEIFRHPEVGRKDVWLVVPGR
jgi:hypothetical protein